MIPQVAHKLKKEGLFLWLWIIHTFQFYPPPAESIENGPHMADKIENRAHIAKEMKMIREIFAETLAEWQLQKQPTNLKLNATRA